jgi:hypothetical protein
MAGVKPWCRSARFEIARFWGTPFITKLKPLRKAQFIRCGEGIYFLHFARKTFDPWGWIQNGKW